MLSDGRCFQTSDAANQANDNAVRVLHANYRWQKTVEVLVPAKESGSSSRDEERDAEWRQLGDNSESVGHGKNWFIDATTNQLCGWAKAAWHYNMWSRKTFRISAKNTSQKTTTGRGGVALLLRQSVQWYRVYACTSPRRAIMLLYNDLAPIFTIQGKETPATLRCLRVAGRVCLEAPGQQALSRIWIHERDQRRLSGPSGWHLLGELSATRARSRSGGSTSTIALTCKALWLDYLQMWSSFSHVFLQHT